MIRGLRVPVHLSSREALRIFDIADIWAARTGEAVRLVSANDHVHSRRSAHYAGLALDLHSSRPAGLAEALERAGYRVLWNVPGHYGHVHAEYTGPAGFSPRPLPAPALLARSQAAPVPVAPERRRAVGG